MRKVLKDIPSGTDLKKMLKENTKGKSLRQIFNRESLREPSLLQKILTRGPFASLERVPRKSLRIILKESPQGHSLTSKIKETYVRKAPREKSLREIIDRESLW